MNARHAKVNMATLTEFNKTYKPFLHDWAVDITKKHEEIHWTEDEADLSEDVSDWKLKLDEGEKEFITNILRLFTQGDVQVGQNYYDFLIPRFKNNEVRVMLGSFASREGTHQRAYALLNDTLGLPDEEYHKFLDYKEMSEKIDFMQNNDTTTQTGVALALAKGVMNEGVALFASFVMLLNFQRFGKMKGMGTVVEWSIRDETVHVEGGARLFREFCNEHPRIVNDELKSKIYTIAERMVELEDKFIDLAFGINEMEGLTSEEVKKYIRYIADRRLISLGLKGIFKVKRNPLPWVEEMINAPTHTNFFENRATDYAKGATKGDWADVWGKAA